jgi:hypothetical protein
LQIQGRFKGRDWVADAFGENGFQPGIRRYRREGLVRKLQNDASEIAQERSREISRG